MKPDSETHKSSIYLSPNPQRLNVSNHTPIKPNPRQKLKPSLSKTLKQQIDQLYRQQWISDAAYYKAGARGFIQGYEATDWLEAERDYVDMLVELFLTVVKEDDHMTKTGLQELAKAVGVPKPERIDSKLALIRAIQASGHREPCFKTKADECCHDRAGCHWDTECRKLVAEWRR